MPFHDNGLLFLTTSLVIQIYDLEHDARCERHTVFALKCFRRHMLLEICSKCGILLKCCPKCEKVLKGAQNANSAQNSRKCSKGAQRNRERPTPRRSKKMLGRTLVPILPNFIFRRFVVLPGALYMIGE